MCVLKSQLQNLFCLVHFYFPHPLGMVYMIIVASQEPFKGKGE